MKSRAHILRRLNYVTNLALAYRAAVLEGRQQAAADYAAKILNMADGHSDSYDPNTIETQYCVTTRGPVGDGACQSEVR